MSKQNVVLNTGYQAIINTDRSKTFLWNRRSQEGNVNNSGLYDPITLLEGLVMGRVSATGLLKPFRSTNNDGSQFPIGVLLHDYTIDEGDTVPVFIGDDGDIAAEKLIFDNGTDTLDTVVSSRRVIDHLKTYGIKVITSTEMTGYDNQ